MTNSQGKERNGDSSVPKPPKTVDDNDPGVLADFQWLLEQQNLGAMDMYDGQFVAVYNKKVIAYDQKFAAVRRKAAKQVPDVPAARFAIEFVEKLA